MARWVFNLVRLHVLWKAISWDCCRFAWRCVLGWCILMRKISHAKTCYYHNCNATGIYITPGTIRLFTMQFAKQNTLGCSFMPYAAKTEDDWKVEYADIITRENMSNWISFTLRDVFVVSFFLFLLFNSCHHKDQALASTQQSYYVSCFSSMICKVLFSIPLRSPKKWHMSQQSWMDLEFASTLFSVWFFWTSPNIQHQQVLVHLCWWKTHPNWFHFANNVFFWGIMPWVGRLGRLTKVSLQETNISYLGEFGKSSPQNCRLVGNMLVPCRVTKECKRLEDYARLTCMTCCSALSCVVGLLLWFFNLVDPVPTVRFLVNWFKLNLATKLHREMNNEATLPLAEVSWVGSSSLVIHMKLTRADDQVDVLKVTWRRLKQVTQTWVVAGQPGWQIVQVPKDHLEVSQAGRIKQYMSMLTNYDNMSLRKLCWGPSRIWYFGRILTLHQKSKISTFPRKVYIHVYMKQAS